MSVQAPALSAIIIVRMVPPKAVWPNTPVSWQAKAAATAEFRQQAGWATKAAVLHDFDAFCWVPSATMIVMDVVIAWPKGQRRLDDDNAWASLKACRDGIAEILEVDDRRFRQGVLVQTHGEGTIAVTLRDGPA